MLKKKRRKQLEWMQKMYRIGQTINNSNSILGDAVPELKPKVGWLDLERGLMLEQQPIHVEVVPPQSKKREPHDLEFDKIIQELEEQDEPMELLKWTKALDFDSYHAAWLDIAATASSDQGSSILTQVGTSRYDFHTSCPPQDSKLGITSELDEEESIAETPSRESLIC